MTTVLPFGQNTPPAVDARGRITPAFAQLLNALAERTGGVSTDLTLDTVNASATDFVPVSVPATPAADLSPVSPPAIQSTEFATV